MRRVAANWVFLPGYPLLKFARVELDGDKQRVVDTGGVMKESEGLEFYGGLLVAGSVLRGVTGWQAGDSLTERIAAFYAQQPAWEGLALIRGADLRKFCWTEETMILTL